MSVPITTIQGSDNVGLSRLTINTNFAALKAASDEVTALLDPSTLTLSGIKSVTIDDTSLPLTSAILAVSKGASILGVVTLGTIGASTSVLINGNGGVALSEANLTIALGNFDLQSATSLADLGGHLNLDGELRLPGVSTAFASSIGLTSATPYAIPVSSKKYLVVTNGATNSAAPFGLTASLQTGSAGQVVELYHVAGASGPVRLSWQTTNATSVSINGITQTQVDGSAIFQVGPNTTTFTLTASGPTGTTTTQVTVNVTGSGPTSGVLDSGRSGCQQPFKDRLYYF
jgi:hypothetical protein